MKYLIITKECDFISNSLNAKKHLANSNGDSVMVYDKFGWWIRYARRKNGIIEKRNAYNDGISRKWAIDFIREHKVGDSIDDARKYSIDLKKD